MIPLKDYRPSGKIPFVSYLLIFLNILAFGFELLADESADFVNRWALIGTNINFLKPASLYPFLTYQFLHAGFIHLLSNMWFLRIFADNVEDRFGHFKFLVLYLFWGIVAGLSQYVFATGSTIPMVGASGAVAGVMGSYYVFFPHHQIRTLIPIFGFWRIVDVPASFMLFYWFITQLFAGVGSLSFVSYGGVAFFAHAGGFLAGWLTAKRIEK